MIDLSQARSLAPGNCIAEAPCQVIKDAKFCATPASAPYEEAPSLVVSLL
jgi:hypothetical protein